MFKLSIDKSPVLILGLVACFALHGHAQQRPLSQPFAQQPQLRRALPLAAPLIAQSPPEPLPTPDGLPPIVNSDAMNGIQNELRGRGQRAFAENCTQCHEAEKALTVRQSYADWIETIEEMVEYAEADEVDLDKSQLVAIATYLATRTNSEIQTAQRQADQAAQPDAQKDQANDPDDSAATSQLVQQGERAFHASCVTCHDAERSLSEEKSFTQWMSTIRRMAAKDDAEITSSDMRPIATFLSKRTAEEIAEAQANASEADDESADEDDSGNDFDPALVAAGRTAFYNSCVKCHDAQRSLGKSKSLGSWRATVRRMAAKDGADVAPGDVEAISVFLASETSGGEGAAGEDGGEINPWTFSSTLSTLHRSSSDPIENPGFFVDAWVSADWQSDGPLRATITACTSCHSDRNSSKGFTFELVEASATVDLKRLLFEKHHSAATKRAAQQMADGDGMGVKTQSQISGSSPATDSPVSTSLDLKMGRFVVPFGAFSSFSHPGSYRTLTNPLMYNMGRRLDNGGSFQPVLPAPYSDEGVNLRFGLREYCNRSYTLDLFAVNGLQGTSSGTNFNFSRSYTDNNRTPAVGARYTLGNQIFRLGFSGMLGHMQTEGSNELDYHLLGADALINAELWRAYFEYAYRQEDVGIGNRNEIDGYIVELELKLFERIGLLSRYDTLEHELASAGDQRIDRFTWGINFTFERAGLLLLNHEHWMLDDRSDVDVIGARWITTF